MVGLLPRFDREVLPWLSLDNRSAAAIERALVTANDLMSVPGRTDTQIVFCRNYPDDYLGQQATKLLADTFTDADYICHVNSDCIFRRPTAPEDLIDHGRACVFKRPREQMGRYYPWQEPTERFLGWSVASDFMQLPPFVFPRWLYAELRDHANATHGVCVETYIQAQPARGFSEYNALSGFAWERFRERFTWIDALPSLLGEARCRWYWSWGGIDDAIRSEILNIIQVKDDEGSC